MDDGSAAARELDPAIAAITPERLPSCLPLSAEAGWNQTAEDWALFFERGTVFGITDGEGALVATSAVLPFHGDFAWVSMVLVTAARRRERLGTRLLEATLVRAGELDRVPMLDATPAGERVYRPLGFEPIFATTRWRGVGALGPHDMPGVRRMVAADLDRITAIDRMVFGADRAFLLRDFFRRVPHLSFVREDGSGFALARPGRMATQVGPIVAASEEEAVDLLAAALDRIEGPVLLDMPDRWAGIGRFLAGRGFAVERPYLRMARGIGTSPGEPERMFVVGGPEFG